MNSFLLNFLLEIGLFTFLGILYYFWQRRRILQYEKNKEPLVMGYILQSCLTEKKDVDEPKLDALIHALDDYLHNRVSTPPLALLKIFSSSSECSQELRDVIVEGLKELEPDGKK